MVAQSRVAPEQAPYFTVKEEREWTGSPGIHWSDHRLGSSKSCGTVQRPVNMSCDTLWERGPCNNKVNEPNYSGEIGLLLLGTGNGAGGKANVAKSYLLLNLGESYVVINSNILTTFL